MDATVFYDAVVVGLHCVVFFMGFQSGMHR